MLTAARPMTLAAFSSPSGRSELGPSSGPAHWFASTRILQRLSTVRCVHKVALGVHIDPIGGVGRSFIELRVSSLVSCEYECTSRWCLFTTGDVLPHESAL